MIGFLLFTSILTSFITSVIAIEENDKIIENSSTVNKVSLKNITDNYFEETGRQDYTKRFSYTIYKELITTGFKSKVTLTNPQKVTEKEAETLDQEIQTYFSEFVNRYKTVRGTLRGFLGLNLNDIEAKDIHNKVTEQLNHLVAKCVVKAEEKSKGYTNSSQTSKHNSDSNALQAEYKKCTNMGFKTTINVDSATPEQIKQLEEELKAFREEIPLRYQKIYNMMMENFQFNMASLKSDSIGNDLFNFLKKEVDDAVAKKIEKLKLLRLKEEINELQAECKKFTDIGFKSKITINVDSATPEQIKQLEEELKTFRQQVMSKYLAIFNALNDRLEFDLSAVQDDSKMGDELVKIMNKSVDEEIKKRSSQDTLDKFQEMVDAFEIYGVDLTQVAKGKIGETVRNTIRSRINGAKGQDYVFLEDVYKAVTDDLEKKGFKVNELKEGKDFVAKYNEHYTKTLLAVIKANNEKKLT